MDHVPPQQDRVGAALAHALRSGRLAHGLLFLGPTGAGKERAARALACGLMCDAHAVPWGCGKCRSCERVLRGVHPDVHVVLAHAEAVRRGLSEPEGGKKPSEQIVVDDIRSLAGRLRLSTREGGPRVALVIDAERMNPFAQNALLKTLEEPGASTTLVLTCADDSALLPTLVSRCLRLRFSPPAPASSDSPLTGALLSGALLDRLDAAEAIGRDRLGAEQAIAAAAQQLALAMRAAARGDNSELGWREASSLLDGVVQTRAALDQNANPLMALEELLLSRRIS